MDEVKMFFAPLFLQSLSLSSCLFFSYFSLHLFNFFFSFDNFFTLFHLPLSTGVFPRSQLRAWPPLRMTWGFTLVRGSTGILVGSE